MPTQVNLQTKQNSTKTLKRYVLYTLTFIAGVPLATKFSAAFLEINGIFTLFKGLPNLLNFAVFLTIFLIPLCLSSIFIENLLERITLSLLIPISFIIGITLASVGMENIHLAIIFLINLASSYIFLIAVKRDKTLFTKFKIRRLFAPNIKLFIAILAVSLSFVIYLKLSETIKIEGLKIPTDILNNFLEGPLSGMFQEQVLDEVAKSTGENMSQEELLNLIQSELPETIEEGKFRQDLLPENLLNLMKSEMGRSDVFSPNVLLNEITSNVIGDIENFLKPFATFILILVSLGIFWFIQFAGFLVTIVAMPLISFTFHLLKEIGFIIMEERDIKVEIPSLG